MDYNQNGMGYDPNNTGYNQNNMGYNPNGQMGGGYPQQQMPMQPMQQQQMMQQQRFGGMQQGYGMNQPMQQQPMMNQPMQQDYGMPQQNIYNQSDMSYGGGSSDNKQNPVPIIIAMILVLVIGGVIIWFLLKDNDSGGSSKKKSKEETKIEIKAPSKAYSGSLTDYSALKKYYEDSYGISCSEDGNSCYMTFSKETYLALEKEGSKLKQVMVGDTNKNSDTYTILLAPFGNTGEKKEEIEHAISWMDESLMYSDQEFEISVNDGTVILKPEPSTKSNDNLVGLKGNNQFTLSNIEYDKKYTVDVQHYNNNFKKIQYKDLHGEGNTSSGSFNYEEDGYSIRVSYRFDEEKVRFEDSEYTTILKEYNDESRPEKGGRWCYTRDSSVGSFIECYDYVYLAESSVGHGYGFYFITRAIYTFDEGKSDLRSSVGPKAAEYIKKLHSGVKVVS